jgi:hypothetical protein
MRGKVLKIRGPGADATGGMRFGRGLLATIGATTSLIAAGSLALFAVSAIVAFKGWPDIRAGDIVANTTAIATHAPTAADPSKSSEPIVLAAVPRKPAKQARRAAGSGQPLVASVKPVIQRTRARRIPAAPAQTVMAPAAPVVPAPEEVRKTGDPVREVTSGLGETTKVTTKGLGDTVRPVSPELGKALDDVGTVVGNTVDEVGEIVGALLDGDPQP